MTPRKRPIENIVGKAFSPFPAMFSSLSRRNPNRATFEISSAKSLNLVKSKILPSDEELRPILQSRAKMVKTEVVLLSN